MSTTHPTASIPSIGITGRRSPPAWAIRQRQLIDLMDRLAGVFIDRYTLPDGTLKWRKAWPGMDGADDGYESYLAFPLFYVLGGGEHIHDLARRQWNAVTKQFTAYGQVHREFAAYYDWLHHGESYTYIHYLGMADPSHDVDRKRALRFAAMYSGLDPEAPNWDPALKMIRSPINGSRGPRFEMSAEDWSTHRKDLSHYPAPYEDIPGFEQADPSAHYDWTDDEKFAAVLKLMNQRMVPGDVPLNLSATSLITNAFLYSGEEKYRQWVLDYLRAWMDRTDRNDGILPDNVGPTGRVGERMNGKWWGGYYGWRWPHGARLILEPVLIAGCNATLLTGDPSWLDLFRSQADMLWSLRKQDDGTTKIPGRRGDQGWFDYLDAHTMLTMYIHLYFMSRSPQDLDRIEQRFPHRNLWGTKSRFWKGGANTPDKWFAYVQGENPDFPQQVLDDTHAALLRRLDLMESEDSDTATWDVHHWQERNPVIPEGLIQMAWGTPAAVYHGGVLHASVRYFDPRHRRPGLPADVSALVQRVTPTGIVVTIVNTNPLEPRDVILQAGSFGEHLFTEATTDAHISEEAPMQVNSKHLAVRLGPAATAQLSLGLKRFAGVPSYAQPCT